MLWRTPCSPKLKKSQGANLQLFSIESNLKSYKYGTMKNTLLLFLLWMATPVISQVKSTSSIQNKGKFFLYWGWNRGYYSDSDITFKGADYDFTLKDVKAADRPTPFTVKDYFHPGHLSTPQTNYRIGYFFKENYTISLGVDHMKYVVAQNQNVPFEGHIDEAYGMDTGSSVDLTADFLKFEHTDGLNYISLEISRFDAIGAFFGLDKENFQIHATEGIGLGVMLPRTNSTLLSKERYDAFHLSGFGLSARAGIDFTFYKYFFVMTELKTGYIYMPDIRTTQSASDSASQSFGYLEPTLVIGGRFSIF